MTARSSAARVLLGPAIAAALCFALLVGLGVWQLQRLAWKEAILARIDARVHAQPQPVPARKDWASLRPADYDYQPVSLRGVYDPRREALIFRPAAPAGLAQGPGYTVVTPMTLDGGGVVLVNRGFAPLAWLDGLRTSPPAGETTVTGLMRPPEDRNAFTPADTPAKGVWYTRDPASMAAALGLADVAPFVIDAAPQGGETGWPRPGATEIAIPNNHLSYALTWFGLAAALVGVFAVWARSRLRAAQ
ncbi:MAG: SURF1 family protein [Hyphomicrobiales bacterium]|nr:SURF1 family protein [Hyphomicrobiales bacterium]